MRIQKPHAVQSAFSASPRARLTVVTVCSACRRLSTTRPTASSGQFSRSDFGNQPFTGIYEAGQPTQGPLGGASIVGSPRITPRMLKDHLDQFVVGQERAKKVLSTAVYNHYQRIQELHRQDEEFDELVAQQARREVSHTTMRHPTEDEFPGQQPTVHLYPPGSHTPLPSSPSSIQDYSPLTIEKSNVLLLGPSGVGKTLMAKTLARVLEVPFSMSDCTPLTQAGYIGEDAEVVVQRLLAAANYDVGRAESGIICLDEIDKIATAKVSHGKDVSGEGVQQALLKIIEGTTLQIQAKQDRNSAHSGSRQNNGNSPHGPNYTPLGGNNSPPHGGGGQGGKSEIYNVRTDNILFICTGAFIGLHKVILDRISKGSIGFGANVRAAVLDQNNPHSTTLKASEHEELFKRHIPFFTPASPDQAEQTFNTLDLVEPTDLQKFGMIPELVGRIPVSCALSSLGEEALVRVLTEPRNALLKQYEQLFALSGVELRFTSPSLRVVAAEASKMGTGARGLKTVLERLLGEAMFETPGSATKYIVVTEDVARRKRGPIYLQRGQGHTFHSLLAEEEEMWQIRQAEKNERKGGGDGNEKFHDFREFRETATAARR